ncbi:MAG: DUF3450 domain-containing protein [Maricaulaceae bacterium]
MSKLSIAKRLLLTGAIGFAFAVPASAQLDSALSTAKSSTAASAASQGRVSSSDDAADTAIREFRAVQQQIDNIKLFVDQQNIFLASQKGEIDSLNNQLGTVEQIKQGMVPMMLRMTIALEDSIKSDIPFLMEERLERVQRVKEALSNPDVSPAEQYRVVLNAFKIEVSYGQGLDSYEGAHPTRAGNVVNFLRFGRTSFVYMSKDESELARYSLESKSWEPISGDKALSMRKAIRVAKGEAAPDVVYAPVVK